MAQLDRLLSVMISNRADSLSLKEGEGASLMVEGQPRPVTKALTGPQVIALYAGYSLGLWAGLGAAYVGILGAAVLSFYLARRLAGPAFLASVEASPRAA